MTTKAAKKPLKKPAVKPKAKTAPREKQRLAKAAKAKPAAKAAKAARAPAKAERAVHAPRSEKAAHPHKAEKAPKAQKVVARAAEKAEKAPKRKAEAVAPVEIAAPPTFARYTGSYKGGIYGYEQDPWDSVIARSLNMMQERYIKGLTFADLEQCKSARAVIVTCEEIVPESYLRLDPDQNALPPFLVDAVVRVPYGAHPTACRYFYDYDPVHLNLFKRVAKDDDSWQAYLEEWVYGLETWDAYLDKIGGAQLARIRANTVAGYAPGLDRR